MKVPLKRKIHLWYLAPAVSNRTVAFVSIVRRPGRTPIRQRARIKGLLRRPPLACDWHGSECRFHAIIPPGVDLRFFGRLITQTLDSSMKLIVSHHSATRFDIAVEGHTVITDQPVEDGGQNAGMGPVDLFVGSLASCVAYFVGRFCTRHHIASAGFTVEANWSMAEQPHRVGRIDLRLHLHAPISPEQRDRLLKVAHGCTVHQSLVQPPSVAIQLAAESEERVGGADR